MTMTLDQIVEEARQLPQDVVAELVDRILETQHSGTEHNLESAWRTDIRRRIDEIKSGKTSGIPVEETLSRARTAAGL